jgi:hypothetical protein
VISFFYSLLKDYGVIEWIMNAAHQRINAGAP